MGISIGVHAKHKRVVQAGKDFIVWGLLMLLFASLCNQATRGRGHGS
jgi:hypothetical protein